jgi:hypothetical protein
VVEVIKEVPGAVVVERCPSTVNITSVPVEGVGNDGGGCKNIT